MSYKIEEIPGSLANIGEAPHWDVASQNLYYVDIKAGTIFRYSYNENKVYKAKVEGEEHSSFIIPVEGTTDQFAVGCERRVLIVRWDGVSKMAKAISTLFEVQMDDVLHEENRLNDGKCDSLGRLFAGTMRHVGDIFEHRRGELYKYEKDGKVEMIKSDVGISNGLTWNDKTKKFYFADTADFEVKEYDYDVASGKININKPKVVLDFRKNSTKDHLLPDGLTIDTQGNVYVATFNGSSVYTFNPSTGKILLQIKLPCLHITSVAFGGPNLDILFVTTANVDDLPPPSGSVFKVTGLGAQGYPMTNIKIMSYKIEEIPGSLADMGEGPHWDVASQNLYYVDINAGKILRYSYNENKVYKAKVEGEEYASFIIPVEGTTDQFAVGCGRRVLIVRWDGISKMAKAISTLFEVQMDDARHEGNRLNDGKCDSLGRLFAGTMRHVGDLYEHRWGELYKYEKGGKVELIKSDVGISNGLTWNDKIKKFYFADTADFEVKEYDYDVATGKININKPKVVLDFRKNSTNDYLLPDGLTIDTQGNVYVATFNGSSVYTINPSTGKILLQIKLPCLHVTSVAFGGPNLDILFVTTANEDDLPPPSGSVFKVTGLGVQGYPMTNIKI
ncbi:uncharacterized protein LOC135958414 [Calliphora vicina]|uniref:uncharacterized protein LOC135958414 n=1 Tax=Calliphora vicina TaxID=7373 RepID=UPI00325B2D1C